jgi:hypothetical protein
MNLLRFAEKHIDRDETFGAMPQAARAASPSDLSRVPRLRKVASTIAGAWHAFLNMPERVAAGLMILTAMVAALAIGSL